MSDASPSPQGSSSLVASSAARSGVWVVDDSPLQLDACRVALESQFEVKTFRSGGAALEALSSGAVPQVMVLDWHMPDMSGLDVCQFVRGQYSPAHLPVLILTASGHDADLVDALAMGANDFVHKPVSDLEIRARVAGMVRLSAMHADLLGTQRTLHVEAEFRERFMGMLAHDLRQPLNTMYLASQALGLPEGAPGRVPGALAMQSRAAARMKRMIDELLDFTRSRPETGMPVHRQPTDLARVARAVVDEMGPGWPGRELRLATTGPCMGLWDPDRLAQVCSNLIGNALEHSTAKSPIEVRVAASANVAELSVSNAGAVIPPEVLATLFEPFRRGQGVKPSSQGVGLGLYIVAQIVRAHGGTVSAKSTSAQTQFEVALPI
jgi:two-component system, sensor histidine kinase and response regulator